MLVSASYHQVVVVSAASTHRGDEPAARDAAVSLTHYC